MMNNFLKFTTKCVEAMLSALINVGLIGLICLGLVCVFENLGSVIGWLAIGVFVVRYFVKK